MIFSGILMVSLCAEYYCVIIIASYVGVKIIIDIFHIHCRTDTDQ